MVNRAVSIGEAMIEMSGGAQSTYRMGFAGDTLNTAYYLRARLGEDWTVDYFTALGDDHYSTRMIDFIAGAGIGTGHIRTIAGKRPGLYMIHQAGGDRHFTYWRDTSAAKSLADDPGALRAATADTALIFFSGITLGILSGDDRATLLTVLAERRREGVAIAFDPNIRPSLWPGKQAVAEAITQAASVSTYLLPTHDDEAPYFGDADDAATARRYLEAGCEEVVVKNGADPALVATGEGQWRVGARPVETVIDATGAGDSFNGGYLAARLGGASPQDAAAAGHETAAAVIGHHGAIVPRAVLNL